MSLVQISFINISHQYADTNSLVPSLMLYDQYITSLAILNIRNLDWIQFPLCWLNHKSESYMLICNKFCMNLYLTDFYQRRFFFFKVSYLEKNVGRKKQLDTASSNYLQCNFWKSHTSLAVLGEKPPEHQLPDEKSPF